MHNLDTEAELSLALRELAMYTRSDIPDEQMSHKMREALENAEHLLVTLTGDCDDQ